VAEFAEKLSLEGKRYVFAVATCVAIPGKTLVKLREILREGGADLTAGFAVKAGNASMMKLNTLDKMMMRIDRQRKRLRTADARLEEIVQAIGNLETHRPETSSWCANAFGSFFHEKGLEHFKNTDRDFAVTGDCKGCGNCAKVCPRNNISMVEGRPSFHHDCELCHACVQWCPNFAIRHPNFDMSRPRYHHPAIRLSEMLAR